MNKIEKKRIRQKLEAEQALEILKVEIESIRYVKDWAMYAKCSKSKLNQLMKARYGVTPKSMLKNICLEKIKQSITKHPDFGSYAVACECGLNNEQNLYKFLNKNFDTTFSDLKFELLWSKANVHNG